MGINKIPVSKLVVYRGMINDVTMASRRQFLA